MIKRLSGLLLFIAALVLASIVLPIGFLIGVTIHCFKGGLNDYYRRCALSIDMMGNSFCGELFNLTLAKPDGYPYGAPKETISSATGKNLVRKTLTATGKTLSNILNLFQPNHALISIDNTVNNE